MAGATGVIGRRLIPLLIARATPSPRPCGLRTSGSSWRGRGRSPCPPISSLPRSFTRAVRGHDAVVNMATHIPSPPWRVVLRSAWAENDRVRREGSANLVDAAIAGGAARFIQESFAPVYPDCGDQVDRRDDAALPDRLQPDRSRRRALGGALHGERPRRRRAALRRLLRPGRRSPRRHDPHGPQGPGADAGRSRRLPLVGLPRRRRDRRGGRASSAGPGAYNVVDDQPLTHREYFDSLAAALGVAPPRLPPRWVTPLFGSIGKLLARSLRISNLRFRSSSPWDPRYPSVREGWPSVLAAVDGRTSAA